jgi:hypothetical protein
MCTTGKPSASPKETNAALVADDPPVLTIAHVLVRLLQTSVDDEKASASCRIHLFPFDAWVSQG